MIIKDIYELRKAEGCKEVLRAMGWTEQYANDQEVKRKTDSLIESIFKEIGKEKLAESNLWNVVNFEGQNKRDSVYGKSFNRMVFRTNRRAYTIISDMTGAGAKYICFENGKATPLAKMRSMKSVAQFLIEKFDE